jgi:hypothetical protein
MIFHDGSTFFAARVFVDSMRMKMDVGASTDGRKATCFHRRRWWQWGSDRDFGAKWPTLTAENQTRA